MFLLRFCNLEMVSVWTDLRCPSSGPPPSHVGFANRNTKTGKVTPFTEGSRWPRPGVASFPCWPQGWPVTAVPTREQPTQHLWPGLAV